jgi:hypothetical protein
MKFLGLSITRVTSESNERPARDAMEKMVAIPHLPAQGRNIRTFRQKSITDLIVFPEPKNLDNVWEAQRLVNLVNDVEKMFDRDQHIDICKIRSAVEEFNIAQTPRSVDAFEKLRIVHCEKFSNLLPGIYEQLPDLLTCVFTGGVLPKENFAQREV